MLVIRREQRAVLDAAAMVAFENDVLERLRVFSPQLFAARGHGVFLRVVRLGFARARAYGFSNRGPLRFYVELMVSFGVDFDSDPQYPWAAAALAADRQIDQMTRANRLYVDMKAYFAHVAGPDSQYAIDAASNARAAHLDAAPAEGVGLDEDILDGLRRAYPRKSEFLGDAALRALVRNAFGQARAHRLATPRARRLLSGLMFGFGHGVLDDPLYPWIATTLLDAQKPEEDRVRRTCSKTMTYLDKLRDNLGG
jgi:hypothetical protein